MQKCTFEEQTGVFQKSKEKDLITLPKVHEGLLKNLQSRESFAPEMNLLFT